MKKYSIAIILSIITLMCLIVAQSIELGKYKRMAKVESDIIRNYHDFVDDSIFIIAQEYLELANMDTTNLMDYSYCY